MREERGGDLLLLEPRATAEQLPLRRWRSRARVRACREAATANAATAAVVPVLRARAGGRGPRAPALANLGLARGLDVPPVALGLALRAKKK